MAIPNVYVRMTQCPQTKQVTLVLDARTADVVNAAAFVLAALLAGNDETAREIVEETRPVHDVAAALRGVLTAMHNTAMEDL